MSFTVDEMVAVRVVTRGARPTVKTKAVLVSDDDITPNDAYQGFLANIDPVIDGLLLNELVMAQTENNRVYHCDITYAIDPIPTPGNPFAARGTTRGGTAKVYRARETVGAYARPGQTPRQLNGALDVEFDDGKATVNGVDIVAKHFEFSWDVYLSAPLFTTKYLRFLYASTPSINSATWAKGLFLPAEALFLGADWDYSRDPNDTEEDVVKLSFHFAGSHEESITVNDVNSGTPIVKPGWHHLWMTWEESRDPSTQQLIKRPSEARIERLYNWLDFKQLGLGL